MDILVICQSWLRWIVNVLRIVVSVLKCTELCNCGKGVFKFGYSGRVVLGGLNFVLIQLNSQVVCVCDFRKYLCYNRYYY